MERTVAFCRTRDGKRLAYMTWGEGPVLIVPPGWVSHLELQWHELGMESLCARLARSFRLVFYDRRGCGLSERARDDFTLDAELADLEDVVDEVTDGPVSLLGVSHAGPLAIAYAAAHRERVRHLVLFGAYHRGDLLAPPELQKTLVALVHASWGIGSHALASIFVPGDQDPEFRDRFARFQREAADEDMGARLLEGGYHYDVTDAMAAVRVPTLVIHRRGDRAIRSRLGIEIAAAIEGARLVMLEGDVHLPWIGDWETIAELVEGFAGTRVAPAGPRPAPAPASREAEPPRHRLIHYRVETEPERSSCRLALAQIGERADVPVPGPSGAYRLPDARVEHVARKVTAFVERAAERGAELLVFPEMSIDLNHAALERAMLDLARARSMVLVAGGYHDETTRGNVCVVFGREGVLWQQRKHIPAFMRAGDGWIAEPIETPESPLYVVAATHLGRIGVAICRDFLDLELRVALKNTEPPIDLVINPAFTPVTADFQAAHFEARRALYACSVFCNFALFGDSLVESPEKGGGVSRIPAGEERLEITEVPLFAMRSERSAWDARAHHRFVQSTRH